MSKESGLNTYRDADGTWTSVPIDEVATPEAFARDPVRVHAYYNSRRRKLISGEVAPNAGHLALARLQQALPDAMVVTQNVDNLHERAGSPRVIHMHGELLKARCLACAAHHVWREDITVETPCPACGETGRLRSAVVWFNERPLHMPEIIEALRRCRLFIAIGTSGSVYPAAGFVDLVPGHSIELNLAPSAVASHFAEAIYGPASETVPALVERLLAQHALTPPEA
ncbi:MAG TPA: NAD-dependent deacylase [Dongiaceae bacterium]